MFFIALNADGVEENEEDRLGNSIILAVCYINGYYSGSADYCRD